MGKLLAIVLWLGFEDTICSHDLAAEKGCSVLDIYLGASQFVTALHYSEYQASSFKHRVNESVYVCILPIFLSFSLVSHFCSRFHF